MITPRGGGAEYRDEVAYEQCIALLNSLADFYGITITGIWKLEEMSWLGRALAELLSAMGRWGVADPLSGFASAFGSPVIHRAQESRYTEEGGAITAWTTPGKVTIFDAAFRLRLQGGRGPLVVRTEWEFVGTLAHEFGHIWDRRNGHELSEDLRDAVNGRYRSGEYASDERWVSTYHPNEREDWAETFRVLVVNAGLLHSTSEIREAYLLEQVWGLNHD
jgi:hypothetical protein